MDTFIIITIIWAVICIIGCIIGFFGIAYNLGKIKGFEEFKVQNNDTRLFSIIESSPNL